MAKSATASGGAMVDAKQWRNTAAAVNQMSDAYRAAAASSGLLTTSQLRARPEVERHTEMLQKQKLALRDIVGTNLRVRNSIREVYKDQLRLQRMTVTSRGIDKWGREISDITVPKTVPRDLDTINNKIRFSRNLIASASEQMINWGKNTQWAGRQLTVGFTYPMALFAAATGKMAYDIDKELTRIQKVYDSTLGSEALSLDKAREATELRAKSYQLAADMARKYGAAATDVLKVEAALAATGINGNRLLTSTEETVRIATLGELDFTQATEMTIALQTAFKDTIRTSGDLTRAFNLMNAVENATSLSIQDIAEATPRAASALSGLGVSVDQMTVLLTAMRSAGIDAAEGANALKSVSARIINPGVLAGAQGFFNGFADLEKLSKQSGGNLYDFVVRLGEATKSMSNYQRQQGFAKLFGAWQYNRGAAIVKNMTDAMSGLGETSSQTARAIKTAEMSATELASIADSEIRKKMESLSGRFDAAWESIKVSAAQLGEAFLPIATDILNIFDKLLVGTKKFFESMPSGMKKVTSAVLAFTALVGPLVMMAGLFGNMLGWGLKLVGLGTKFNVMNRAQMAAEMQAKRSTTAFLNEAQSVAVLTAEINALAAAQGYSAGVAEVAMARGTSGAVGRIDRTRDDIRLPAGYTYKDDSRGRRNYYDPAGKRTAGDSIPAVKQWKMEQAAIERSTKNSVKNIGKAADASSDAATQAGKVRGNWDGAKVASGIMGAALFSTFIPGAEKFSSTILTAATAIMGIAMAKDLWKNMRDAQAARAAASAGSNAAAGAAGAAAATTWGKVWNMIKKVGAGLLKFVRGFGLIGAALTAITVGLGVIWKKSQQSSKVQKEINNSTDKWAEALGGVAEGYETISKKAEESNSKGVTAAELAKKWASDDSEMKPIVDKFRDTREQGDTSETNTYAMAEYIKLIDKTNLTARDAKVGLESMFLAAGYAADEASEKADSYFRTLGDSISSVEYGRLWDNQLSELFSAGGDFDNRVDGMVKEISDTLAKAPNAFARGDLLRQFQGSLSTSFADALSNSLSTGARDGLAGAGVTTTAEIKDALQQWMKVAAGDMTYADMLGNLDIKAGTKEQEKFHRGMMELSASPEVQKQLGIEQNIVQALSKQYGVKLDIYNIESLMNRLRSDNYAMTVKDAQAEYRQRVKNAQLRGKDLNDSNALTNAMLSAATMFGAKKKQITDAQKLEILNQLRVEAGLKRTTQLSDGFKANTRGTAEYMEKTANSANKASNAMAAAQRKVWNNFKNNGAADAYKGVWESVTSAVGSEAQASLSASQSAASDALDRSFDREEKALDRREAYWDKFYERAIDKANRYYDRRIEAINKVLSREEKANEIRQRLFDAEQTRLQRMAESRNANIDFNMALSAGKLDEAAKLMNDAQARVASNQMDDEKKRADYSLDVRRDSLEKQIDLLEKQRDRRLKGLEDARDAKNKAIAMTRERVQRENEIERRGLQRRQEMQSRYYEMALSELNSYIPKSRRDLERHISDLNSRYSKYGVKLKAQSGDWAQFIGKQQNLEMAKAANRLRSEVNWAGAGYDAAKGMLSGMATAMGFGSVGELKKWMGIETKAGKRPKLSQSGTGARPKRRSGDGGTVIGKTWEHTGGEIGRNHNGKTGRIGFTGGMSSQEIPITAQKGEFMMSKKATGRYGVDFMKSVNDGSYRPDGLGTGGPSGGGMARAAISAVSSMMVPMLLKSAMSGLGATMDTKSMSGAMGPLGMAKPGRYGGTGFEADQLANAAIIAQVGRSMGMTSRDIVIGLMTAMQESMLRNVNYGDRDSLGLFQQRPSQGWGTPAQVTNPRYASRKFFEGLKGIEGRENMSLTAAAQAVQRSAYPDAYAKWEDEARAIIAAMASSGGGVSGGFVQGSGGRHRVTRGGRLTQGIHYNNGIDIGVPVGTPVYAVSDGVVSKSYDIRGYEPRASHGGLGYKSYGRVIAINHGGFSTLLAHLSRRSVSTGQRVRGGAVIGASGNTGNSSGPHIHFEAHGASPYAFLKSGGTIKNDNTPAILHKNERVLSAPLTSKLDAAVDSMYRISKGGTGGFTQDSYNDYNFKPRGWTNKPLPAYEGPRPTSPPKPSKPSKPKPGPGNNYDPPAQPAKPGQVRSGTYNVWQKSPNANTINDLKRLSRISDILSLAEYRTYKAKKVNGALNRMGWGVTGVNPSGTAIAYNRSVMSLVKSGVQPLSKGRIPGMGGERKFSPYGLFKLRKGGGRFWQVAVHTIAKPHRGRAQNQRRAHQFAVLRSLQQRLSKTAPVIMAGDFNSGYMKQGDHRALARIGMAGSRYSGASTMDDRRTYHDQILTKGLRRTAGYTVVQKGMKSDHNALVSSYRIPGLKKGGEIKWDNTIINAHKNEKVLTAPLSKKLDQGIDNFANGAGDRYNFIIDLRGAMVRENVDIERAVEDAINKKERKVGRKRTVS